MTNEWQPINVLMLRRAIKASNDGNGRYVYARATNGNGDHFRIVRMKYSQGQTYGYALNSGTWFPITEWIEA